MTHVIVLVSYAFALKHWNPDFGLVSSNWIWNSGIEKFVWNSLLFCVVALFCRWYYSNCISFASWNFSYLLRYIFTTAINMHSIFKFTIILCALFAAVQSDRKVRNQFAYYAQGLFLKSLLSVGPWASKNFRFACVMWI